MSAGLPRVVYVVVLVLAAVTAGALGYWPLAVVYGFLAGWLSPRLSSETTT